MKINQKKEKRISIRYKKFLDLNLNIFMLKLDINTNGCVLVSMLEELEVYYRSNSKVKHILDRIHKHFC